MRVCVCAHSMFYFHFHFCANEENKQNTLSVRLSLYVCVNAESISQLELYLFNWEHRN